MTCKHLHDKVIHYSDNEDLCICVDCGKTIGYMRILDNEERR